MKIVSLDPMQIFTEHVAELENLGEFVRYDTAPQSEDEIIERTKGADIVINFWIELPASVIEKMSGVKLIIGAASGYDWMDIDTATKNNIQVAHCPGHNAEAVAEHTIALMLAAARRVKKSVDDTKSGNWNSETYKGLELKGKTLGILGNGHIGKRVGEIAEKGFGMNVQYIDSKSSQQDFENLLQTSDVISINVPLNEKTRGIINKEAFGKMKDGVILVNTGRGAIVNEDDLVEALKTKKVFAVGLDTLSQEPPEKDNPLFSFGNVVITPHIAWNTKETDYNLSEQVVKIVKSFVDGDTKHIVPEQS